MEFKEVGIPPREQIEENGRKTKIFYEKKRKRGIYPIIKACFSRFPWILYLQCLLALGDGEC